MVTPSGLADYFAEAGETPLLTAATEIVLARRVRAGDAAAAAQMARANLRLVVNIARRYEGRGVDLEDRIQDGSAGLLLAIDRFDPDRGFRFTTYATWWIRQAITRGIDQTSRAIRLPSHVWQQVSRVSQAASDISAETGREATNDQIAARLKLKATKVRELMRHVTPPSSIDTLVSADGRATLEGIADAAAQDPHESAERHLRSEQIERILLALPDRERAIIRLRFGRAEPVPYAEVGRAIGVSRAWAEQLEKRALAALRESARAAGIAL